MSSVRASDVVSNEVRIWERMKAQLIEMCPDLEDDEEALLDTLDGETNLSNVLASLARAAVYREAQAKAMKDLIKRYRERQARHEAANESIRKVIIDALVRTNQKNVKHADVTISLRPLAPKYSLVADTDIEMLPDDYLKTEIVKSVDMEKVIADAENGVDLDFIVKEDDRHSVTLKV